MDKATFSAAEVARRLDAVLKTAESDDAVAATLKAATGYVTTGEKIRRARNGDVQKIAHDLLAAVAVAYDVPLDTLVFGATDEEKPAPLSEERVSAEAIGDEERLSLIHMLTVVQSALATGPGEIDGEAGAVTRRDKPQFPPMGEAVGAAAEAIESHEGGDRAAGGSSV